MVGEDGNNSLLALAYPPNPFLIFQCFILKFLLERAELFAVFRNSEGVSKTLFVLLNSMINSEGQRLKKWTFDILPFYYIIF